MHINGVRIEDTFAEAFPMWASRLIITADTSRLARQAAESAAGLATSIIGCHCEAGCGEDISPEQTPDGRPGKAFLLFSTSSEKLEEQLFIRIGQAVLPSATCACFNGLESSVMRPVGGKLRYYGDGFQQSKRLAGRRFWRIPVADGEFVVDESFGLVQGVGGGNLILMGGPRLRVLEAAEAAVGAIRNVVGVIAPFPGGVCRSPSKPGSRYANVRATTNQPFCPTLRRRCESRLPAAAEAAYEIVIDGLGEDQVARAMELGIRAACQPGVECITAGNYGGKLGPYHFHLHDLLARDPECA
jgi:formylmethanofuran--tetrahydromethanopterin N-formyltransferase